MNAAAAHAHAGTYGVDAIVVALYGNFRALARVAHDALDGDQAVVDLRHLQLKQPLQELARAARDHHPWVAVTHLYVQHHRPDGIALLELILRDLLELRQDQLVVLMHHQDLVAPDLIHLTHDDLADQFAIVVENGRLLEFLHALSQQLLGRHHGPPPKLRQAHRLRDVVAHLVILV